MTRHVLMCEPVHFRIAYEINPWMHRFNQVDGSAAVAQWRGLYDALAGLGVAVELVQQDERLPDMTFTANAGIFLGRRFIPANFRYAERQPEAEQYIRWFEQHGYQVERIHQPHYWEGEGDVLPAGERVFAGYRFRTEDRALDHLDELLGKTVVRLALIDPRFYHLDTCFCPLNDSQALYYPPAFGEEARAALARSFADLIAVDDCDALRFACNAVVVDRTIVLNNGCPSTEAALKQRGFECVSAPTDEFIKAGGSAKCLVLSLDMFPARPGLRT